MNFSQQKKQTYSLEDGDGGVHDPIVPVLSGNLERQPGADRVQRVGEGNGRDTSAGTGHEFVRVLDRQVCAYYFG